ncbi:CotH kinase family protein [Paraglaciecola sp. L3A3]|uniref:CotH kinase family protein n=1 Tax=Paraglaciecola sp. L3A3 TaxID=2686358 RepID=UPI00131D08A0|nr:CotH kinase family protein [Paraglaciecola sp. L3A3]
MKQLPFVYLYLSIAVSSLVGCGSSDSATDTPVVEVPEESTPSTSSVIISEVVAKASDDGNDWIELYVREGPVDLSTLTLTDDDADREPQALPQITANTGEYIVIQAIDEESTPPEDGYYVTFKLGSDDAVTLFENGIQIAKLDWADGDAAEGYSYGLLTVDAGSAETLTPTPGEENEAAVIDSEEEVERDLIVNENAPLRINEVVAKDKEDGHDWIELFVTSSSSVNLSDYTISDQSSDLLALPDVTLYPGEFYRIYATTDVVTEYETVGFNLGSDDEIRLYQGDDLVDQIDWNKGQALIGFSYGRFPDGSDATKTLSPTPEETNLTVSHGPLVINEIMASDANGGDDWFELYNSGNQNIALVDYQVIDSSDDIDPVNLPDISLAPGEYLVVYAIDHENADYYVPFKLGKTDELSLLLNDETVDYIEWDDSDVAAGYSYGISPYVENESTELYSWTQQFLSPTLGLSNELATAFDPSVVTNLYVDISDANWESILASPLEEEYHETAITLNGITLDSVAIRTKGGSSLSSVARSSSDRYSFKVDINEYVDGQKFFGLKKFTLQNSFNDPSYMREVLTYDLMTELGVPAPQHAFVNLYINEELFGLYLMVEAVDGEFAEKHFANSNGDMYKPDGTGSDLVWINDNVASYSDINLKTNEETTDNGAFINFVEEINAGWTDSVDIDGLLRYMAVSTALSNLDSYQGTLAHNYYLYEQDGVFSLLPWDFNESFGTFSMGCRSDIRELYIDEPTSGAMANRPLINSVFAQQDNLDVYHDYIWQLVEGSLEENTFATRVAEIAAIIRTSVENDPTGFYGSAAFEQNLNSTSYGFYGLTDFVNYRVNNMVQQLNGYLPTAGTGNGFCGN